MKHESLVANICLLLKQTLQSDVFIIYEISNIRLLLDIFIYKLHTSVQIIDIHKIHSAIL